MSRTLSAIAAGAILLFTSPVMAEEVKIGFIDSAKIFAEYKGTEDAQRSFDQEVEAGEMQAKTMKAKLDSLNEEYQKQSGVISPTRKADKEQAIREKQPAYEPYVQSV